jgi:hypothetical protein
VSAGTPGVEDAALSRGDSGKAGVSAKAVVAGAAAVAGVAAAGAAVAASKTGSGTEQQPPVDVVPEGEVVVEEEVAVVDQPPPGQVVTEVLIEESDADGYTTPTSTEGVQSTVRNGGDDPMIGGGSR